MELEIGIEDILNKRKIESDRIEFKAGWNPDDRKEVNSWQYQQT